MIDAMNTLQIAGWTIVTVVAFIEIWRLYWRIQKLEENMNLLIACFEKAVENSKNKA